eukprot:jgi/Botrbrau1/8674/Bobra.0087s0027.1
MAKRTVFTWMFTFLLRVFATVSLVVGVGFIAFGCVLESPPKTAVPALLVTLGVLTLVGSVFGYAGARFHPILLTLYLIVGTCATTLQLVLVLAIFGAQNKVADAIINLDTREGKLGMLRQVP